MPGLRDILLVLLVLAAIYIVVLLIRLTRVGRRNRGPEAPLPIPDEPVERAEPVAIASPVRERHAEPAVSRAAAIAAYEDEVVPESFTVPPAPTFEWDDVKDLFGETAGEAELPTRTPQRAEPPRQGGFGESLAEHLARTDMETEMQRMRDEMERMRREMEEMRTARRVSPQYAEAMELAQRGCTAQDVADRLGISLAEAELVHALSRGRQNFDEGEEHGADGNPGGFDAFGGRRAG